jgi:MFS transporter, DHA2 family, multidrug resistance protein
MAVSLIDFDEPDLGLLEHFDWWGLGSMALFLGSLEFVLEEGPGNDWFEDRAVLLLAVACILGAVVFFWRVFSAKEPIVDLRAFADRNFASGSVFSFVMGIGLYGLTYLVRRGALVMSFADVFLVLTVLFLLLALGVVFVRNPSAAAAGGGGH